MTTRQRYILARIGSSSKDVQSISILPQGLFEKKDAEIGVQSTHMLAALDRGCPWTAGTQNVSSTLCPAPCTLLAPPKIMRSAEPLLLISNISQCGFITFAMCFASFLLPATEKTGVSNLIRQHPMTHSFSYLDCSDHRSHESPAPRPHCEPHSPTRLQEALF